MIDGDILVDTLYTLCIKLRLLAVRSFVPPPLLH